MSHQYDGSVVDADRHILHLAVIGAGLYGIQAARTYLEIHPDHNVAIFEADEHVGGVWSSERVFDSFITQTPLRIAEFSDLPLQNVSESECYHGFFPARYVTSYLEHYVSSRTYRDVSLKSRILTNVKVEKLTKTDHGWKLTVLLNADSNVQCKEYHANKIIDATGLTSVSNMPLLPGRERFRGTILHHRQFASCYNKLRTDGQMDRIVIIGGAKSAADVAYACAKAGKKVVWIIRKNGAGPAAFVSTAGVGPYKNSNESFYTRFTALFLTSIYVDESASLLGRLLYRTIFGRCLFWLFWFALNAQSHRQANYHRKDGTINHFQNLKPDTSLFWQQDSTGIRQHPDFFDVIARQVQVFRQDLAEVEGDGVVLDDGQHVRADMIICATGWRNCHPAVVDANDERIELDLGLAGYPIPSQENSLVEWKDLESKACEDILKRFPHLKNPPVAVPSSSDNSSLRLYKGVVPIGDHHRSIAFVGQMLLGNNFRVAEAQALFAVAALDGNLTLPSTDEMKLDVARHLAWSKLRYLKKGLQGTWIYWDTVPYTDDLLAAIGLKSHRHRNRVKDLFATCFAADLRELITEYKEITKAGDS